VSDIRSVPGGCSRSVGACWSKDAYGYTSLAIFSIRSSYSCDPLIQRFDLFQQRLQNIPQLHDGTAATEAAWLNGKNGRSHGKTKKHP
jgi:hypothetical protein